VLRTGFEYGTPAGARSGSSARAAWHAVRGLLMRPGLEPSETSSGPADPLAEESPVLAGIVNASGQGRIALGARSGARVRPPCHRADAVLGHRVLDQLQAGVV
jgi:hypothetical protein